MWLSEQNILYFNPRPRKEGDLYTLNSKVGYNISIHALVKRATIDENGEVVEKSISIHALVKRATILI